MCCVPIYNDQLAIHVWLYDHPVTLGDQYNAGEEERSTEIHLLKIIEILETDFNTALKFFFASQIMTIAEENGLSDEQ